MHAAQQYFLIQAKFGKGLVLTWVPSACKLEDLV